MKRWISGVIVILVLLAGGPAAVSAADMRGADGYCIGPGDVLEIAEWKNPDLTKTVVVLPDGKITFPLVGEVQAGGKTVGELTAVLTNELTRYVPAPNLSVVVHQVNSLLIYVIGKVNNPGRFVVNANVNVLQALAMAGGLNSFARRDQVRVFRTVGAKTEFFAFDYDAVSMGEDMEQNIVLRPGDVVVVR